MHRLPDDLIVLIQFTNNYEYAKQIFSEQIKLVHHNLPYALFAGICAATCFFLMMVFTIDITFSQLILNIKWLFYQVIVLVSCWYFWNFVRVKPTISKGNINAIYGGLFVVVITSFFLSTTTIAVSIKLSGNFRPHLVIFWTMFHILILWLCHSSWRQSCKVYDSEVGRDRFSILRTTKFSPYRPKKITPIYSYNSHNISKEDTIFLKNFIMYRTLLICSYIIGFLWAMAAGKIVLTNAQHYSQVIVLMGLNFGMLAGAMSSIGIFRRVYIAFSVPALIMWIIVLVNAGGRLLILAFAIIVLLVTMMVFAKHIWITTIRSISIHLENNRLIEELQVKTAQIQENSKAKTQLLATASHDLRQPVHALSLFLETLGSTNLDKNQLKIVNYAKSASKSSNEMLNTILDYAHIESGEVSAQILPCRLQNIITVLFDEFKLQAELKDLKFEMDVSDIPLMTDPALLSLILRNLISNAIRYTNSGSVLIRAIELPKKHDTLILSYCRIDVVDTGTGIESQELHTIFDSFSQLKRNRKSNQGLGLGLAIVKGLTDILNIPLNVDSKFNVGTTFSICVPMCDPTQTQCNAESQGDKQKIIGKNILVVDDDLNVLQSMKMLLEAWQCVAFTASTLDMAIDIYSKKDIQLVITDYHLGNDETGEDVILEISDHIKVLRPKFIILTANTKPTLINRTQQLNPVLLHKPIEPNALKQKLIGMFS